MPLDLELLGPISLLLLGLILLMLEFFCICKTGSNSFMLLYRKMNRSFRSKEGLVFVAIPSRYQAQASHDNLKPGTEVAVVDNLPLIPEHDKIHLTSKEAKLPGGHKAILHSVERHQLILAKSTSALYPPECELK